MKRNSEIEITIVSKFKKRRKERKKLRNSVVCITKKSREQVKKTKHIPTRELQYAVCTVPHIQPL